MAEEVVQFGERELGELAAIIRYYRRNGLWSPTGSTGDDDKRESGLLIKNTESNVIPAYGCMEVVGTVDETQNYIRVKKPTSTGTLFLFNGHYEIEVNGYGVAQNGPVYRAYKSTGSIALGEKWKPTSGQYYLTKDTAGQYVVYGSDDIGTDVFRVVLADATVSSRLVIARLSAAWSGTAPNITASADLYDMAGNNLSVSITVRDPLAIFAALGSGDDLLAIYQDGKYYAIQAPC